jgi:membrane protein
MVSVVIGIVTLIIGASTVFGQLQSALNQIWEVEAAPAKSAIGSFIRTRVLSLAMVIGIGFLLLVSLIVSAALAALDGYLQTRTALPAGLWQALNLLTSLGIIALLFALMFKLLPDVKLAWRDVWFGAFVTAALFTAGKYLIGLYLGHASIGSSYGAAGSVVVLMVWVYYSSLIVFLGAEITQVRRSRRLGESAAPAEHAVHKAR